MEPWRIRRRNPRKILVFSRLGRRAKLVDQGPNVGDQKSWQRLDNRTYEGHYSTLIWGAGTKTLIGRRLFVRAAIE